RPPPTPLFPYTTLFRSKGHRFLPPTRVILKIRERSERIIQDPFRSVDARTGGSERGTAPPPRPPATITEWVPDSVASLRSAPLPDRKSTRLNSSHVKIS